MSSWFVHQADEAAAQALTRELRLSPLRARLMVARGLDTPEAARAFLDPSPDHLHDPFLFDEMREAVRLVRETIAARGRILVHGDYDADGICGTALLAEGLRRIGADVHYFVPDRVRDGYGIASRVIERSLEVGIGLLITVDCGSSDDEIVRRLAAAGVPVIITDHHEIGGRIPEASAVLNPKLPGERYPFKELCGTGVALKLMQALQRAIGVDIGLSALLDLAAVGTLGDYVGLAGENRTIVALGMRRLAQWERPGFEALRRECGLAPRGVSAKQVCFNIVPRLNSPGRIGSAREVVEMLLTADEIEAAEIAARIEEMNRQRRAHDSQVTEEASYLADIVLRRGDPSALVFSSSSWHEGVVGIGAARLAENYDLPAVLIAVRDGLGKGSARSAGRLNIRDALERCSRYLVAYGGHREAGGFTIAEEHIPEFIRAFNQIAGESPAGDGGPVSHWADAEIRLQDCELDLVSFIEKLEPFGPGNHEPLFLLRGLRVGDQTKVVGKGHLRLTVEDPTGGWRDLIGFSLAKAWDPADLSGAEVDVLAHLRRNAWQGREEAQVQVTVIRPAGEQVPAQR
ncbi:MAG: single-stranded-DNA-specific exonuclease RecJ [Candidatus Krumholzibacteria bacterium]|nr:single-stranded-DNA-specific exonuclease RecJ [Candidatus Krumholzibacteria bacterium]